MKYDVKCVVRICALFVLTCFGTAQVDAAVGGLLRAGTEQLDKIRRDLAEARIGRAKKQISDSEEELAKLHTLRAQLDIDLIGKKKAEDIGPLKARLDVVDTQISGKKVVLSGLHEAVSQLELLKGEPHEAALGLMTKQGIKELLIQREEAAKARGRAEEVKKQEMYRGMFGMLGLQEKLKFLASPRKMAVPLAAVVAAMAAWQTFKVGKRYAEAYLFTPKLISESSIGFMGRRLKLPPSRIHEFVGSQELKDQIQVIIDRVKLALRQGGSLTNAVFYGPPGTGKTMMAQEIASQSGMDYAIFSAGDFNKLSPQEAKVQLEKIFNWAKALTGKGKKLIVFIDEADAFLLDRRMASPDQIALQTIFLNRIEGQRSDRIMFIFATNFYEKLDIAVLDRIDDAISFNLPAASERRELLDKYMNKYVKAKGIKISQDVFNQIVAEYSQDKHTKGFSGRVIEGLAGALEDAGRKTGTLTYEDAERVIHRKISRERFKQEVERLKQTRFGLQAITTAPAAAPAA